MLSHAMSKLFGYRNAPESKILREESNCSDLPSLHFHFVNEAYNERESVALLWWTFITISTVLCAFDIVTIIQYYLSERTQTLVISSNLTLQDFDPTLCYEIPSDYKWKKAFKELSSTQLEQLIVSPWKNITFIVLYRCLELKMKEEQSIINSNSSAGLVSADVERKCNAFLLNAVRYYNETRGVIEAVSRFICEQMDLRILEVSKEKKASIEPICSLNRYRWLGFHHRFNRSAICISIDRLFSLNTPDGKGANA